MPIRFNFWVPDQQMEYMRSLSDRTGLTVSDLIRRMMDHCAQPVVLNNMFPTQSGTINMTTQRKV